MPDVNDLTPKPPGLLGVSPECAFSREPPRSGPTECAFLFTRATRRTGTKPAHKLGLDRAV